MKIIYLVRHCKANGQDPSTPFSDNELKFEGGESSSEALTRGMQVIREMVERPEKTIVIVTHGALLSLLIKQFNKEFGYEDWKSLSNPDVYKLELHNDGAVIQRIWN
jgi:2,3-bisphosphoglycerate-dependent phosphoglycerate mutase